VTAPSAAHTLPPACPPPPAGAAPAGAAPPDPPARALFPGNIARQLRVLLAERGVERVYHSSHADMAVVSLPGVTVWIGPHTLSWPHAEPPGDWPPGDLQGAADHLAHLVASLTPVGVPWEGDGR